MPGMSTSLLALTPPASLGVEVAGATCTLTLNRPHVMNALDRELRRALGAALLAYQADPALRVAILTGAGGRAFSAGDDLEEMAADAAVGGHGPAFEVGRLGAVPGFDELRTCRKPVIAAVDGWCLAGGFELAMYSDVRLATRASRFGLPEPRRGLLPGPGLHDLPRMVPLGEALRLLLSGGHIPAERAYDIGLVQGLADDRDDLLAQARSLADEIAACAPLSVEAVKHIVRTGRDLPIERAWQIGEPHAERLAATADAREGVRAFAEKRPPVWQGR
jgi:enoyl-CoA hydratase/carnithine racemase